MGTDEWYDGMKRDKVLTEGEERALLERKAVAFDAIERHRLKLIPDNTYGDPGWSVSEFGRWGSEVFFGPTVLAVVEAWVAKWGSK